MAPACGAAAVLLTSLQLALPHLARPVAWVFVVSLSVIAVLGVMAPPGSPMGLQASTAGLVAAVATVSAVWTCQLPESVVGPVAMTLVVVLATTQFRAPVGVGVLAVAVAVTGAVLLARGGPLSLVDLILAVCCYGLVALTTTRLVDHQDRLATVLRAQAAIDGLTGLVTRRVLDEALVTALGSSRARTGTALILVDIDHFKQVNDLFGHPVGDTALQHVASVVVHHVRQEDSVISRLGGDELAVLLTGTTAEVALARATGLVSAVRNAPLVLPSGESIPLTISVGVAHAPVDATDVRALYAASDRALYAAKGAGRDRSASYTGGTLAAGAPHG